MTAIPMPAAYPVTAHEMDCPRCGGEGSIEFQEPGPYSPDAIEPRWSTERCDACHGEGWIEAERCGRCGLTSGYGELGHATGTPDWDTCECDEDHLTVWERGPQNPEVSEAAVRLSAYFRERDADDFPHRSLDGDVRQRQQVAALRYAVTHLRGSVPRSPALSELIDALAFEADALDYPIRRQSVELF